MIDKFTILLVMITCMMMAPVAQSQSTPCTGVVSTYPLSQSFENLTNLWTQWSAVPLMWQVGVGGTPTTNTGPSGASDGSVFLYVEATNNNGSAVLESPCMDLTSLTNPHLSFDYHLWGPDAFRLVLQASTDGGVTWTGGLIFSVINDQGPNWNTASVDLSSFANQTNFRFRAIGVVSSINGDLGDVAIDNFEIGEAPACFEISVNYSNPSCEGSGDGTADLLVYPTGTPGLSISWSTGATTSSITNLQPGNYSVVVTDNQACTKTKNFTLTEPAGIEAELYIDPSSGSGIADGNITAVVSGGTAPYTLVWYNGNTGNTNSNLLAGYEELKVVDANGCYRYFPIFVPESANCSGSYSNWPYHLSLDGNLGRFRQASEDDLNWKKRAGATPTNNTGPNGSAEGTKYRYLESSGSGSPFKSGVLKSRKCFNISNLSDPELYFQYHMYGSQMGQLFVQLSTDGGVSWRENIWEERGDQGNMWKEAFIDLSNHVSSQLVIRIVGRTGPGSLSDIAIDDVHIRSASSSSSQIANENNQLISFRNGSHPEVIQKLFSLAI